ncbi:MAG: GTP-binding protein [Candidatus Micrarchaeota archaeon]
MRISLLGHKDHGKSTLIGRMLLETGSMTADRVREARETSESLGLGFEPAFLLDSFVEERQGGFTLDMTVAKVSHRGTLLTLIDVPGHRELVKNMLSGASMADAAILIVSAKSGEGLQDETRLHVYLAGMLGIRKIIVAINKMDAAGYSEEVFRSIRGEIGRLLESYGFAPGQSDFVPICARDGDNVLSPSSRMPWHMDGTLMEKIGRLPRAGASGERPARMFVQDVYEMGGEKLAVGRIDCGSFHQGDDVMLGPSGAVSKIGAILCPDGTQAQKAGEGQNVAVRLENSDGLRRGCVLMDAGTARPASKRLRARIFCFPDSGFSEGGRISVACSSQESGGKISEVISRINPVADRAERHGPGPVSGGEAAEVLLELDGALVFESFADVRPTGRFVISKGGKIAGVGVVI